LGKTFWQVGRPTVLTGPTHYCHLSSQNGGRGEGRTLYISLPARLPRTTLRRVRGADESGTALSENAWGPKRHNSLLRCLPKADRALGEKVTMAPPFLSQRGSRQGGEQFLNQLTNNRVCDVKFSHKKKFIRASRKERSNILRGITGRTMGKFSCLKSADGRGV